MADGVFNFALGAAVEMFNDAAANGIVLLMEANEAEATLIDRTDLADIFIEAGNTEATATGYARITGQSGDVTVDTINDRTDIDISTDPAWTPLGNGANNPITKLVVAYENAAADATRIPLTHHDFAITPDGSDVTAVLNAAGFFRAD
jgi:hypothetical protein